MTDIVSAFFARISAKKAIERYRQRQRTLALTKSLLEHEYDDVVFTALVFNLNQHLREQGLPHYLEIKHEIPDTRSTGHSTGRL